MFHTVASEKVLLLLLFIFNIFLKASQCSEISPDSKRLYHDIASGQGLYYGFTKLTEMGGSNFMDIVFNKERNKFWIVEFYNSWCGHCHRFAPTWKGFASDVYEWQEVIGVGVVDCANDANNQLCRDLEVMYYPMIKTFPPKSNNTFLGENFDKGTIEEMREDLIKKFKSYQNSQDEINEIVNLKPFNDSKLDNLWTDFPYEVLYLVLIFESKESVIGSEVALDLAKTKEVRIRIVEYSNQNLAQVMGVEFESNKAVIVEKDLKHTHINLEEFTRKSLNKAIRQFLVNHGVQVALELPTPEPVPTPVIDIGDVMHVLQIEEEIKKKLHTSTLSTVVFQIDLELALNYSMSREISAHSSITGVKLDALKKYMLVLIKYFPFGQQGISFLKELNKVMLENKTAVDGGVWKKTCLELVGQYKPFLPSKDNEFIGCRGSNKRFRGYPCGLWTMFHTLTVQEELKDRNLPNEKPEVLYAMADYIKNFFGCKHCAEHFGEMAKTIAGNVTTQKDSILWLWEAHNNVNQRLKGDITEDPQHPKIQFPNVESCPACHDTDGSWNKSEVFNFLNHMYSNIIYVTDTTTLTTATPAEQGKEQVQYGKSLRHEIYGDDHGYKHKQIGETTKGTLWDFNVFDISLCVVLYICSVAILILVCIKFVFRRSYRKKPYIHDILSKV